MRIALLGPLSVDGAELQSRRDRVVLEALVARRAGTVSVEELAVSAAVWR